MTKKVSSLFCLRTHHLVLALTILVSACSSPAGEDGSEILVPYEQLGGNIAFSTFAINGSNGYDLYIVPVPELSASPVLAPLRITDTPGNEWQPTVARNGGGMAFVKDGNIHVITSSGRIRQITDNDDSGIIDSLPAVSADARTVAWVREDSTRAIGNTGFFETYIMMADFDGSNIREVAPESGIIQDTPTFDPAPGSTRLAWSEFDANSLLGANGPSIYGVRIFDYLNTTSSYPCRSNNGQTPGIDMLPVRDSLPAYRCFGQHLTWATNDVLVLSQDMLEISLSKNSLDSVWSSVIQGVQQQQTGIPDIAANRFGFFPRFPLSASYAADTSVMVFDGYVSEIDGNNPTLAIYIAPPTGNVPQRLKIAGYTTDIDTTNTADYLFSVATPTILPFYIP